ncbi:hypothetical protein [Paracoccus aestuarii]|nr:hypothetical protein [Paracoccus aestuarii]WCQ99565.1 hypothetical protein JHW48_02115 [Paracoccus aestuarii]
MTLTFLDTAKVMASVDRMPDEQMAVLLRRLRLFDAKGLVPVHRQDIGRREGRLDLVGACMARLYSELLDFGLDAETLRGLRTKLDLNDIDKSQTHLATAIDAIRSGGEVTLYVELWQQSDPWKKGLSFRLHGHRAKNTRAANAVKLHEQMKGLKVRLLLPISLNRLLGDFISAFAAADTGA